MSCIYRPNRPIDHIEQNERNRENHSSKSIQLIAGFSVWFRFVSTCCWLNSVQTLDQLLKDNVIGLRIGGRFRDIILAVIPWCRLRSMGDPLAEISPMTVFIQNWGHVIGRHVFAGCLKEQINSP